MMQKMSCRIYGMQKDYVWLLFVILGEILYPNHCVNTIATIGISREGFRKMWAKSRMSSLRGKVDRYWIRIVLHICTILHTMVLLSEIRRFFVKPTFYSQKCEKLGSRNFSTKLRSSYYRHVCLYQQNQWLRKPQPQQGVLLCSMTWEGCLLNGGSGLTKFKILRGECYYSRQRVHLTIVQVPPVW